MSETGRKTKKIYYSMGEVSEMFDVNASLIRFWEQKFTILKPDKNKKGNRLFTQQDVDNLKLIYHLVKENGMTLSGAQKRLKENREGIERNLEIIERLQSVKAMLLEVRQQLKASGAHAVEIIVQEDTTPGIEMPVGEEEPVAEIRRAERPVAGPQPVAPEDTLPSASEIAGDSSAWPREQPLFPEYATPAEGQPESAELPVSPESEPQPEVQADKPTEKKMQVIEQTLF